MGWNWPSRPNSSKLEYSFIHFLVSVCHMQAAVLSAETDAQRDIPSGWLIRGNSLQTILLYYVCSGLDERREVLSRCCRFQTGTRAGFVFLLCSRRHSCQMSQVVHSLKWSVTFGNGSSFPTT